MTVLVSMVKQMMADGSSVQAIACASTGDTSAALAAYALARLRFLGSGMLTTLLLVTYLLPGSVTLIPTFLIWNELGLVGTLWPLWAGNLFGSAFYIFMLRQFMRGIPMELSEAARIDGPGETDPVELTKHGPGALHLLLGRRHGELLSQRLEGRHPNDSARRLSQAGILLDPAGPITVDFPPPLRGHLRVEIVDGTAHIDFSDFRTEISGASSSCGSVK